ncbi:MAG: ATP-dependent helicase HrpB [Cyclobacteriaceae bacterium]
MSYPVLSIISEVKEKLTDKRLVILEAPPGAGKSTVLPLHFIDEPWLAQKKIIMLEPRRLAARSVAMRLADMLKEEVGHTIGYRVRFENRIGKNTRLEVVTEGILTRIIQNDNSLEGIGLVIFDEFHERSLQADLALALCLQVQQVLREDLRIMIMSATLDGDRLSEVLNAPVIRSTGKQYSVSLEYIPQTEKIPVATQVTKGIRKALHEHRGDVLAFFPGAGEIKRAMELLEAENLPVILYPLYGDLDFKKQQEAILPDPHGRRKVVLATSIAETSLTIEGVSVVVDSGYSRVPRFDPRSGFTRLETIRVTRDAADQRAGRAGRLGPGVCYRLWSQASHANLVANRNPEILDADLAPLMLELTQWGVKNISDLTWITPPPPGAVSQAWELLEELGAIKDKAITERGRAMLRLPTHPRIAHMLLEANHARERKASALALATDIAALLEERDPMAARGSFSEGGADLSLRIELLRTWRKGEKVAAEKNSLARIERLALSWRQLFNITVDNNPVSDTEVGRWLMEAYPERIGKQIEKHGERYKMVSGRVAKLPAHDPLQREPWLAIAQVDAGKQEGKIFLAAPVHAEDLLPLAVEKEIVSWDPSREMVTASLELRIGNLVISGKPLKKIPEEKKVETICHVIREKGLSFLNWQEEQNSWQARVLSLKQWRPHESWPDVSDENLLHTLEEWLGPFLGDLHKRSELQKLDLNTILTTVLPWDLTSKFERLAPPRLPVPSGSLIRLNYFSDGRSPIMEVRLQEVFGMLETPVVNEGKNKVVMHLLSPGYKPVQVTQDLKSFWATTYAEVRKELRSRYPKHSWPEDPWTAQAVRGAKKRL